MAAAAITTLSLTVPSTASAGTSSQAATGQVFKTYTKTWAGYEMTGGGWRFRYFKTTYTVPRIVTPYESAQRITMELGGKTGSVYLSPYTGDGSMEYWLSTWDYSQNLYVPASVGDKITLSIYYDRQTGKVFLTGVNLTNGSKATVALGVKSWVFTRARLVAGGPDWSTWTFASNDTLLYAFRDTSLTSYSGYHGAILGPWNTTRIIGTSTGTSTGKVVLWPTWPWNNAHNFGVWWRAGS
jgi:hypothetical protein